MQGQRMARDEMPPGGGDALLAGIVHAGPEASVEESARWGLACARCAVESPHAVSDEIKKLIHE